MAGEPINGAARAIYSTVAAASTVISVIGGIMFRQVAANDERHDSLIKEVRDEAKTERGEIEQRLQIQLDAITKGRLETAERVRALEAAIVEIETQFRSMSTIHNLERQRAQDIEDLMQQCPSCKIPQRTYYPPGPGTNSGNGH